MTLDDMQASVDRWITQNTGYWDKFQILARLTEELGEVASALQRQEGLRPRRTEVNLGDEVGDLLFTLAAFANINNLSLEQCFNQSIEKYNARDAQAWQEVHRRQ